MKQRTSKGFTLIELLAVIVILAIIALIATPLIMGVINNARKNSARNNIYGFVKAVELSLASNTLDEDGDFDGVYTIDGKTIKMGTTTISVNYKGNNVSGELRVYNNAVDYGTFKSGSYDVTYHDGVAYIAGESNTTTAYADGTAVYFNPSTGTKCTQAEYTSNDGSATNKKSGCMRWYTFGDKTGNTTIKMILDHNTSNGTPWVSKEDFVKVGGTEEEYNQKDSSNNIMGNNSKGPITVTNKLKDDTKDWKQEVSPRLITANEVAAITGNTSFNSKTSTGGYWFKGNGDKISAGTGAYAWLYSYLNSCEAYGCNKQDQSASWGYATSDKRASDIGRAWFVGRDGSLSHISVSNANLFAVRPVITLSKSKLS